MPETLTKLESEMLTALKAVLEAYKGYGALATRDSEEYTSLTAVRRAIRHARLRQTTCGEPIVFAGGASGGDVSFPCALKLNHRGKCKPTRKG